MPNVLVAEDQMRHYVRELIATAVAENRNDQIVYGKKTRLIFTAGPRRSWCRAFERSYEPVVNPKQALFDLIHEEMYDSAAGVILDVFGEINNGSWGMYHSEVREGAYILIGERAVLSVAAL